ncbi:cytochrome C biogenesis protein [alpha proteobacterium AAP81b]|nr:cytochrome C biogenesis protein [alpha proteobacterium AAP81b]
MATEVLNPALAFVAGALTILSPCVLPLVPIVLSGAGKAGRFGPVALAGGLIVSFTVVGLSVALLGNSIGLDPESVRLAGAMLMIGIGAVLVIPQAQPALERLAAPAAGWAGSKQQGLERFGLAGQAGIGGLLGLVWSPCVGPTLGAATVLASQGQNLGGAAVVMAAFAAGVATVLLAIATVAKSAMAKVRGKLLKAGGQGKYILGGILVSVGILIATGSDRIVEGLVVAASPQWLTDLTTQF